MSRFDPFVRSGEEEEIRHHLEECADALVADGWDPKAARAEAERRFGSVGDTRRELAALALRTRVGTALGFVLADVRYALRGLWLNRTFTFAVVATLALGIGAVSSIFAVVDAAILRPLAFADAERWVQIWGVRADGTRGQPGITPERVERWQEAAAGIFDAWVADMPMAVIRTDGGRAEMLEALAITPGAERLLGIPMLLGRGFTADDARPGAPHVVILRRGYWEELGADPNVIGSTMGTDAGPVTVVGVLDTDLKLPLWHAPQDLWAPLREDFTALDQPIRMTQWVWARRAVGVSHAVAQERVDALAMGLDAMDPSAYNWRLYLEPLGTLRFNDQFRPALALLAAMVGAIYLIALLNGVNLLLVRRATRARELALRASLGASWIRIARQLLTEGLVLGCLGGTAAVGVAKLVIDVIARTVPQDFANSSPFTIAMEQRTLWFVAAAALVAGALLGLLPAIGVRTSARHGTGPGSTSEGGGQRRTRNGLVTAQVALSTVLLVGAVLLAASLTRLLRVDSGFDHERLAYGLLGLEPPRYPDRTSRAALVDRLEERLEGIPEVSGVTLISGSSIVFEPVLEAEGEPVRGGQSAMLPYAAVPPDYFAVTGTRLLAGRGFEPADAGTDNAVVDRDLARFLWGTRDPIGRRFRPDSTYAWLTVIGVAQDLKLMGRDDRTSPYQYLVAGDPTSGVGMNNVVVRTEGRPDRLLPLMERALWSIDPEQTYYDLRTAKDMLAVYEDQPRFLTGLIVALALVAVMLAAVGLYGVLAYSVARRSREIGIRIAIGARPARVRRAVLGEGLLVATIGAALGLAAAFAAVRALEPFLFDVEPRDPALFTATAALLLAVAAIASFLPAQRATRVDPMQVLKAD